MNDLTIEQHWLSSALIICTVALWMAPVIRPWHFNIGLGDIVGCFTAIWCIVSFRSVRPVGWGNLKVWYAACALLAIGLLISVAAATGNVDETIQAVFQYCYVFCIIPFVVSGRVKWRVLLIGASLGVTANVLVAGYFWYTGLPPASIWGKGGRLAGLMANPNAFGKVLAEAAVLFLFIATSGGWRRVIWGSISYLACLIGVLLSASFGASLALVIGTLCFLILARKWKIIISLAALMVTLGGTVLTVFEDTGLTSIIARRVKQGTDGGGSVSLGSFDYKIYRMKAAVASIADKPIVGQGAQAGSDIEGFDSKAHNWPLIVGEDAGILGIAGVCAVFIYIGLTVLSSFRQNSPQVRALVFTCCFVFSANSMTNTHMYGRFWWIVFAIVIVGALSRSTETWHQRRL